MIKEKSKHWAAFSAKLGEVLSHLPFSPNTYSWITLILAGIAFAITISGHIFTGIFFFILAGVLDVADGAVARHTKKASFAGAFLDGSLDRFVDFFVIFSYFWLPITTPVLDVSHWTTLAVFFALMPSFEVAYANHRKAVNDPEEKRIWRILNRGEMYPLMLLVILLSYFNCVFAGYALIFWVVLAGITTAQTFIMALILAKKDGEGL